MARPRATAGLGTTIAVRTFILFCLCAAVPVLVFGFIGYRYTASLLHEQALVRMQDLSKRYGLLLNERLAQADSVLHEIAAAELAHPGARRNVLQTTVGRVRIASLRAVPEPGSAPGVRAAQPTAANSDAPVAAGTELWRSLEVEPDAAGGQVRLRAVLRSHGRAVEVIGIVTAAYLWDSDTIDLPAGRVCVRAQQQNLYCSAAALSTADVQRASWELFLKARYGAPSWQIVVEQESASALAGLRAFRATLPLMAGVTIAIAVLLSSMQIRRSNRPLRLLTDAAMRMSKGRWRERVRISGRDEYANLGRAFNVMAANVRRQFQALSAMAGIDQQILELPAADPIVASLLPRLPRILGCDAAAVLLGTGAGAATLHVHVHADQGSRRSCLAFDVHTLAAVLGDAGATLTGQELADLGLGGFLPACDAWRAALVTVNGELRAVLLAGFTRRRARWRGLRQLAGLAHRLAVVIGNEDREALLLKQAYYDGLTDLPNRQLFRDRLERELLHAAHGNTQLAVLFIDLDHFKSVNDSLGHSAGDLLLQAAARRLAQVLPAAATLARLGGDEFTIVMPLPQPAHALELARAVHQVLDAPFRIGETQFSIQGSVGIALYPQDGANAEDLLRNADTAMYRAKAGGRGRAAFFEESMNVSARRRSRLAGRLRMALDGTGLQLVYQPKVDARTGALVGVEALARWHDAEDGVVSPAEFIPLAEETGLIDRLGIWAVQEACRAMRNWQQNGTMVAHVAVNVSMHQLRDHTFAERIAAILHGAGLAPARLHLEITESGLAADMHSAVELMQRLRELGVLLAIDDFGTGYSSLTSLASLPVDVLKIDKSFVDGCATSSRAAALVRGMIAMGHALDKKIVAEGVETAAQAQFLRAEGCEYLQGYLYGRGMTADDLALFAARGQVQSRIA
ncbi:MAG: EAL domain-containing protein [Steroidobacteraceae bacterium]